MKTPYRLLALFTTLSISTIALADDSTVFCPSKNGYASIGMTQQQVLSACGQPTTKEESSQPFMQRVEVKQLIYNNEGTQTGFYGVWNMPVSTNAAGNGGARLEINVIDDKVDSIVLDGGDVNAVSICAIRNIQKGDDALVAQNACGTPSLVNQTFIMKPVASKNKPEIWVYKRADYLPTITLTFVDGKLQSIEQ